MLERYGLNVSRDEFHEERSAGGEYIPLRNRRPSVRYALPRMVVEDSVALLFSEGHFPSYASPDPAVQAALAQMVRGCRLNALMIDAAIRGSIGSSAILMRILSGRLFFDVLDNDVARHPSGEPMPQTRWGALLSAIEWRAAYSRRRVTPSMTPVATTGFSEFGRTGQILVFASGGWLR